MRIICNIEGRTTPTDGGGGSNEGATTSEINKGSAAKVATWLVVLSVHLVNENVGGHLIGIATHFISPTIDH